MDGSAILPGVAAVHHSSRANTSRAANHERFLFFITDSSFFKFPGMHTPLCAGKTIPIECKGRCAPRRTIKRCILSCSGPACRPHSFCRTRRSVPSSTCWKLTRRRSDWSKQSRRMKNSFLRSASSPSQSPSVPALPRGEPLAKPGTLPYCQSLPH